MGASLYAVESPDDNRNEIHNTNYLIFSFLSTKTNKSAIAHPAHIQTLPDQVMYTPRHVSVTLIGRFFSKKSAVWHYIHIGTIIAQQGIIDNTHSLKTYH
jgi:hypothetical protein